MYFIESVTDGETKIIHDSNPHNQDRKIDSGSLHLVLNGVSDFSFTLLSNHPEFNNIKPLKTLIRISDEKGNIIWRGRVLDPAKKMSDSGLMYVEYTAEDELSFLIDSQQRKAEHHNMTPREYLQMLIDSHNNSVKDDTVDKKMSLGLVDITNSAYDSYRCTSYDSTLNNIFNGLVKDLGGYISLRYEGNVRYLDYLKESGTVSDMTISLADNLQSIESHQNPSDVITRLIPLGASIETEDSEKKELTIESVNNGLDYIDNEDLIKTYGIIEGFATWNDITDPEELLLMGTELLKSQNIVDSVTINAADLSLINEEYEEFKVGRYYIAKNEVLGINQRYQLISKDIDIVNPVESSLSFGTNSITMTQKNNNIETAAVNKAIEESKRLMSTYEKSSNQLNELMSNALGYYATVVKDKNGASTSYMHDKPKLSESMLVWKYTSTGFAVSTDGGQTWNAGISPDGNATLQTLNTNGINADWIKTGIIQSSAGSSFWDLDNGKLVISGSTEIDTANGEINTINDLCDDNRINSKIDSKINAAENLINNTITEKHIEAIETANRQLDNYKSDVGKYLKFDDAGLSIGADSSSFKTIVDNKSLRFTENDTTVAYINNNQLNILNAIIRNTLKIGNFFFSPRDDGGVSITWQN